MRPNFEDPLNTAQQLVDNNIRIFGRPTESRHLLFKDSEISSYIKLAENFDIAKSWDEFYDDFGKHIIDAGTHAYIYTYLWPEELELGRWWRSVDPIPFIYPYAGYTSRKNWHLNEVQV